MKMFGQIIRYSSLDLYNSIDDDFLIQCDISNIIVVGSKSQYLIYHIS